jgi:hypothetical protein
MFPTRISPSILLALIATLGSACDRFDPQVAEDRAYVRLLIPIMQDNALLSERVLIEAAALYNKTSEPETLVKSWTVEIVPLAEHLHSQASFAKPPDTWTDQHSELVAIWGDRAQAYRALSDAITTADDSQWQASRDIADGIKLAEEKWFASTNERLAQNRLVVDQFP